MQIIASHNTLPGTAPAEALHTFTLDSGVSRCFFRDSTTLTPLPAPAPVRLADPSWGPIVARSSTVLSCPAVPSGSLSGLHLPSFSTNLVSTAALQDAMVTTTTPGGQRVLICTCTQTGRHLATFTRRPGSSLYTLATEPSQVAASAQVSASRQVAPPCSCRLLSHQTLLWHHRLGHPSRPRRRGMHSRLHVSGLPQSLPPFPPSPAPPYLPCIEGWQRAAPHSSSFPPTSAPLQTLHMDYVSSSASGSTRTFMSCISTLTEVSWRSLHDPCGCSPFLWPFVVQYAAHQLNLWPRVSLAETSPTLPRTGEVGDASLFRVLGSRAFIRDSSTNKLSARAIPCVFLGFPPDALGWQFYHPTSRRVFPSQDVTFDDRRLMCCSRCCVTGAELGGTESEGAGSGGAELGGAEPEGVEPGGAEPEGVEPGGAESEGEESWGAEPRGAASFGGRVGASPRLSPRPETLSPQQLTSGIGGTAAAGLGGARTWGTGAAGTGSVGGAGAGDPMEPGATGAGGTGAGGARAGGAGARGTGVGGTRTGGAGAVDPGGTVRPRPYFPASTLPAPSPYTEQSGGLTERREHASCPVSPVRTACRVPRSRPPPVHGTHAMALRPSSVPLRVPLPPPPESSLRAVPDPEYDRARVASPTISHLLTTVVTNPSFESTAASALVAELLDFAAAYHLDYATALVGESETTLAALGFAPSTADPSLFLRTDTSLLPFYVLVYVDDLIFATADTEALTLALTWVLKRFGFQFSSPQPTPLSTSHSLSAPPSDESVERSGPYPELVGYLMYLMTCTRPYLADPLSLLAHYVAPSRNRKVHWDAAKRVLRYLCSTSGMGLVLGGRGLVVLTGHGDASWWLTYLLTDLGEQPHLPPLLYVDNKAMIALCQEHRLEHRTKHIALRYFLAQELQQRGQLRLAYVATRANTADIFTKALPPGDHQRFSTV
ncbi:unnamed protein product [Closterium sp. NIES-54]